MKKTTKTKEDAAKLARITKGAILHWVMTTRARAAELRMMGVEKAADVLEAAADQVERGTV